MVRVLNQKLWRELFRMRGQVIAIILIVACGIASLVSMMSAYESIQLSQSTYYDQYRFAEVFVHLKRAPNHLINQIQEIPGVKQVQARVVMDVNLDVPDLPEPATGRLISIPETRTPILNDLYLRRGRYLEPGHPEEVLVSEVFANANHLNLGDTIGAVLNQRWENLRIVGIALSPEYIYEIRGTDLFPDNQRFGVIWMGHKALATAFDMEGGFNDLAIDLTVPTQEAEVIFQVDQLLEPFGGFGALGRWNQISHRFLTDEIIGLAATAIFTPSIFLGIAAFLLNLMLSQLVKTQREQIAILKAFGYDNRSVGLHYLQLALIISGFGVLLGSILGVWLGAAMTQNYGKFYHFPILVYRVGGIQFGTAIGVSLGAAVLGTLTAVRRAVQLPPAEAMRPEPPAVYRSTLLERLGLQRLFSPSSRIILRNIERHPVQVGLAVIGIAAAIAILVVGSYFEDAVNHLVDIQFRVIQREDVTLLFNEPLPSRARFELEHLPGVLKTEIFRTVPVRLRHGHQSHLTAVVGLEPNPELRRPVNQSSQAITLPPQGIVLSTKLATLLNLEIGDELTLEVLEADRPKRTVTVTGQVDDLIGLSAYMDLHALNTVMKEGETISGAYLSIDAHAQKTLYRALKNTPAIASVSLRETLIQRFEETIAGNFAVFTIVLVFFACVIAFGVVYNSARIALSERQRELATLRIIGFSQAEISYILLGEQLIVTGLSLPIGFGLGYGMAALISQAYDTELYRFPLIVTPANYTFAFMIIAGATLISGGLIYRHLQHLDLIAVLKTRE